MAILQWNVPKPETSSDSDWDIKYQNMIDHAIKWKAVKFNGNDKRIEIRKSINGCDLLIVVRNNESKQISFSMNGKLITSIESMIEIKRAIVEAIIALRE